jgi:tRNA modification GTPase
VNAGKSSLVNALAGYARSIVSAEPGTTRDAVTTRLVLGGWEIDLVDTAGLREPDEAASATERAGIERALAAAADADLVLQVGQASACQTHQHASPRHSNIRPTPNDRSQPPSPQRDRLKPVLLWTGDRDCHRLKPVLLQVRQAESCPALRVLSKSDLAPGSVAPPGAILTSAHTGAGIDLLAAAIVAALVPEATADPTLLTGPMPFTPRQVALLEK